MKPGIGDVVLAVIATYHDQPPFETAARVYRQARSVDLDWTIGDILRWCEQHGNVNELSCLEITVARAERD